MTVKLWLTHVGSLALFRVSRGLSSVSRCCDRVALKLTKAFCKEVLAQCPDCEEKTQELMNSSDELLKKLG